MSIRNVRKLQKATLPQPPASSSDDEYEPYTKNSPSKFKFDALALSSNSESENDTAAQAESLNPSPKKTMEKKKKKNNKKRKNKQVEDSAVSTFKMDEIDKCLMEVNAMLGPPPLKANDVLGAADERPARKEKDLFAVEHRFLIAANETRRIFGNAAPQQRNKRHGRISNLDQQKKFIMVPIDENMARFPKGGLSMSIQRTENGIMYFTFDHSPDYQRVHGQFLRKYKSTRTASAVHEHIMGPRIEDARSTMHVEGLLECADSMYRLEEYSTANTLIEMVIAYLQYLAHPSFKLTDSAVRLEYKFPENRPFHVALVKHMHLLTSRACHRTALEVAKVLLRLDSSDPLAVLLVIDALALRAREHEWLGLAVDHWAEERDAHFLFNIQYSYAMAHYHIAMKNKEDLARADKLLQGAVTRAPGAVKYLLHYTTGPRPKAENHAFFKFVEPNTTEDMNDLMKLYAKLTWAKWREPGVMEWLFRNIQAVMDRFDSSEDQQREIRMSFLLYTHYQFETIPVELIRHLCIIKPMADLLLDGELPEVQRFLSADPEPPTNTVHRYNYNASDRGATRGSVIYELFASVLPIYELSTEENVEYQPVNAPPPAPPQPPNDQEGAGAAGGADDAQRPQGGQN